MKIVTFNLRGDNEKDGDLRFLYRRDGVVKKIREEAPDVIGFQEMKEHMQPWMEEQLPEYCFVGHGRAADLTNESVPVAFRKDRYKMHAYECFWLSPTPQIPGSKYEGQGYQARTCTAVALYDVEQQRFFRVLNVHLDNISAEVRKLSLAQAVAYGSAWNADVKLPFMMMGDFNAQPGDMEMVPIMSDPSYTDVTSHIPETFHNYGTESEKIDYIFVNDQVKCEKSYIWTAEEGSLPLSDHHPVCAECQLIEG